MINKDYYVTYTDGGIRKLDGEHLINVLKEPKNEVYSIVCVEKSSHYSCESCEYFMSFPTSAEDFDGLCGASTGHHEVDCDEWCARFSPRKENRK